MNGPLVVIVGPTASGKSNLAMELAKKYNGQIICADSRTIYKGMDIGTAKPTKAEREAIPHYLLDVVEPNEDFTVADFKRMANRAIDSIHAQGKLPIMVGGSGLYIDAVLFDFTFSEAGAKRDPINPRHLSRYVSRVKQVLRTNTLVIGLDVPREVLKERIAHRVDQMVVDGFVDEVKRLRVNYPLSKALLAPGYKAFSEYVAGHLTLDEAKALFIRNDFQLAKRQMTWFKRNKNIHWTDDMSEIEGIITTFMNKQSTIQRTTLLQ